MGGTVVAYAAIRDWTTTVVQSTAIATRSVTYYRAAGDWALAIVQSAAKSALGWVAGRVIANCAISDRAVAAMKPSSLCGPLPTGRVLSYRAIGDRPVKIEYAASPSV